MILFVLNLTFEGEVQQNFPTNPKFKGKYDIRGKKDKKVSNSSLVSP
jgi:hypothetical protein